MTVTFKSPTTFVPAFSATTTSSGTAAEGFSDLGLGLDSYEGTSDIADSDELIAQAYGGNFVSGVRLNPAGDLVARAKEFARELPQAGLFLARAGLLAAEGATGAGAAAGIALAVAGGSAVALSGGGLFAAGMDDDASSRASGWQSSAGSRQTPAERLAALRADIVRLVAEGEMLWRDGWKEEAKTKFIDAAQVYQEIAATNGMLTKPEEFVAALTAAADLFERGGNKQSAQEMRSALEAWKRGNPQQVSESPETVRIVPPQVLMVKDLRFYKEWLTQSDNPFRAQIDKLEPGVAEIFVDNIIAAYYEEYFKAGTKSMPNRISKERFEQEFEVLLMAFENRLTDAGKRTLTAEAASALTGIPPEPQITPRLRAGSVPAGQEEIEPLINSETERLSAWLRSRSNPFASTLEDMPGQQLEGFVRNTVTQWFALSLNARGQLSENPDQVPETWFVAKLERFLAEIGWPYFS